MPSTCTRDGWNVASRTASDHPRGPKVATLSVFRAVDRPGQRPTYRYGDANGREFASVDLAHAFALDRGYCQPYLDAARSTFKRTHRKPLRIIMAAALHTIEDPNLCNSRQDVSTIADAVSARVRALSGDVLMGSAWALAVFTVARRLRPDLLGGFAADPVAPSFFAEI